MGLIGTVTATGILANAAATAVVVGAIMGVVVALVKSMGGDFIDRRIAPLIQRMDGVEHRVTVMEARNEGRKEAMAEIAAAKMTTQTDS